MAYIGGCIFLSYYIVSVQEACYSWNFLAKKEARVHCSYCGLGLLAVVMQNLPVDGVLPYLLKFASASSRNVQIYFLLSGLMCKVVGFCRWFYSLDFPYCLV